MPFLARLASVKSHVDTRHSSHHHPAAHHAAAARLEDGGHPCCDSRRSSTTIWIGILCTKQSGMRRNDSTTLVQARPNILLIVTDQQSHALLSCADSAQSAWVHTPSCDRLARSGARRPSTRSTGSHFPPEGPTNRARGYIGES
jgi:hypothetical protein